ncbi:acyltransferase family protein [Jatrophihabitans sp.]|uniref:acyltransferase family protein n=1 Tax=Jatrophihabitans sp. TaxID=1932789 RepID=UPI0030C6EEE0|nr:Peptidoglycan/LPS O-acetylase OafA/YrhL, contains acyltransferase and SGNH-hydrolase domain [Jatrophihabitans sp.]
MLSTPIRQVPRLFASKDGAGVRHDLEGLRAIAVLGVVIYHLRPSWLPGGFAGVDVFFVLSGYFITGLLLREIDRTGTVDLLRFWGRRARRLLPASVLVIVVTVAAGYAMTNALEAHRIARDGLVASVFGMNWRAAYQGTLYLQDPDPSPLVHYWSLGVEEQFYAVWPLLLLGLVLLARFIRPATPRRSLLVLGVVAGLASFLLALHQTRGSNSYAYFGTTERAWQLILGGILAVLITRLARLPQWLLVLSRYLGVALVIGFYVVASTGILYPGRKSLMPALGAALIIAAGEPVWRRRDPLSWLLCTTPAQLGGRYSYSWYLWHYPPLVLLPIYLDRPLRIRELGLCAVGTLLLAVLTYHLLENPVRSSTWLARRHGGRSLAMGAVLIVVGVIVAQWSSSASSYAAAHTEIADKYGHVLVPQPKQAAAELPQPYSNGCFEAYHDPLAKECRYLPNTGHGDVIEVGDSHSAMWFPAVEQMAKDNQWGFRFWGRNSCPFADITKQVDGGPYTACDRWRADVMKRLVADKPSLVIIASLDSGISAFFTRDSSGKPTTKMVSGEAGRQIFQDQYAKNLKILQDAGIRVLVIHDTPGYLKAMPAPDCVLAHPSDLDQCSAPESQAMPGAPNDLGAAAQVDAEGGSQKISGSNTSGSKTGSTTSAGLVSTVDFTKVFCHGGRCYQVVGSTLAYRDYNHLTIEMVLRLEPELAKAATQAMHSTVHDVFTKPS